MFDSQKSQPAELHGDVEGRLLWLGGGWWQTREWEADRRCQGGSVLLNAGIGYCTSIASFARW
jgi:hypothetical protein